MDAEKLFLSERKSSKCDFKSKAQYMEVCFFFIKWNVICNEKTDFMC